MNDFEAAESNQVDFMGYNNENLRILKSMYIDRFREV